MIISNHFPAGICCCVSVNLDKKNYELCYLYYYIYCSRFSADLVVIIIFSFQSSKDQRLVYSGKLLLDHLTLKDVLRMVSCVSFWSLIYTTGIIHRLGRSI